MRSKGGVCKALSASAPPPSNPLTGGFERVLSPGRGPVLSQGGISIPCCEGCSLGTELTPGPGGPIPGGQDDPPGPLGPWGQMSLPRTATLFLMLALLCVLRGGGARRGFPQFVLSPLSKMNIFLSTMQEGHLMMDFSVQNPRCPESRAQVLLIILSKNVTSPKRGVQGRLCLPRPQQEVLCLAEGPVVLYLYVLRGSCLVRALKPAPMRL
ncbi:unnamed protein product [Gulo gulo]|uniref:Uncharacterized protein n=1 Tax=Gulo gulo TaxID=48420 RepID=A0A9X9MF14_GULGU|nr:unnamed protein product [Gulo gulo]